ncbi:MAG: hypothetical protein ACRDT8_06020 [Micromonosporaceae bacterium]
MTTPALRIAAAGIALIIAVLTGLFTGMVGGQQNYCGTPGPGPSQAGADEKRKEEPGRRGGVGQNRDNTAPPRDNEPGGQNPREPDEDPEQPGPGGGIPGASPKSADGTLDRAGFRLAPFFQPDWLGAEFRADSGPRAQTDCGGGFSVPAALVGFVGALLAGGAVTGLLFLRRRDPMAAPAAPVGDMNGQQHPEQTAAERSTLVQSCIYVRDRATSKALADRLGWALQEVGVATVAPTGMLFDPAHHEAGGSVVTADPSQAGVIAAVEVPGYVDRGVVLRAPVVTVFREEPK